MSGTQINLFSVGDIAVSERKSIRAVQLWVATGKLPRPNIVIPGGRGYALWTQEALTAAGFKRPKTSICALDL